MVTLVSLPLLHRCIAIVIPPPLIDLGSAMCSYGCHIWQFADISVLTTLNIVIVDMLPVAVRVVAMVKVTVNAAAVATVVILLVLLPSTIQNYSCCW